VEELRKAVVRRRDTPVVLAVAAPPIPPISPVTPTISQEA
jgi:hypothetical protein